MFCFNKSMGKWLPILCSASLFVTGCGGGFKSSSSSQSSSLDQGQSSGSSNIEEILASAIRSAGARLVMLSSSQQIPVGTCSGEVVIGIQSSSGSAITFIGAVGLAMTGSSSSLQFYTDPLCQSSIVGAPMLEGTHGTAKFYFKGSSSGTVTVRATLLNLIAVAQTETVTSPGPSPSPTPSPVKYTVTVSATNAQATANNLSLVNAGGTVGYTVSANSGFVLSPTVGGTCPHGSWNASVYTTGAINSNCTVMFSATALPAAAVNGSCGSANGLAVLSAPQSNLCANGTASALSGTGPWNWTCQGSNGGTTAACSAPLLAYNGDTCPRGVSYTNAGDGCLGAQPSGSTFVTNFFSGHTGTTYTAQNRPPWNVAAVDYPVGYSGTLKDPTIQGNLPSCANFKSANVVSVNSAPCTLDHLDFSLHGGICVLISSSVNSPNPIVFSNDKFAFGPNCNPNGGSMLGVVNGAGQVELTIRYCDFRGDNDKYKVPTAIVVDAAKSGNLLVEYSAFWDSPQHDIQFNVTSGKGTFQYNYAQNMGYLAPVLADSPHGDWVISNSGSGSISIFDQFNTLYAPSTSHAGNLCYITTLGATLTSGTCQYNTMVSSPGPEVGIAYMVGIDPSPVVQDVTIKNNYMDIRGAYGYIYNINTGSITGTKTCSGNRSLINGAPVTGTFGTRSPLTCN